MDRANFKIIRGARILQQIEAEETTIVERSTYQDLERSTVRAFPYTRKRQYATHPVRIVKMEMVPYVGTKNLLIKGQARSGTRTNIYYKPMLFFNQVQYEKEPDNTTITFKASDGNDYHIHPIDLSDNIVRVRCDCLDFYFRFAPWDFSNDDLYGPKPKPYVRKTTTRPSVNPTRAPGICKHVMKLVLGLRDARMLKR